MFAPGLLSLWTRTHSFFQNYYPCSPTLISPFTTANKHLILISSNFVSKKVFGPKGWHTKNKKDAGFFRHGKNKTYFRTHSALNLAREPQNIFVSLHRTKRCSVYGRTQKNLLPRLYVQQYSLLLIGIFYTQSKSPSAFNTTKTQNLSSNCCVRNTSTKTN